MKAIVFTFLGLLPLCLLAQLNHEVIQIPMRDGQHLAADLYLPSDQGEFPVILIQTPYNKNLFRFGLPLDVGQNIANSPYAFVVLDWRCFYASTSACGGVAERGEDGYDAVEWIASQSWSTGKVGTWGLSALGNIQFMTAREKPPHLVCAVPMVASPQTRYGQFYPGGVALAEYVKTLGLLFGGAFSLVAQNPYYNLIWQFTEASTYYPDELEIPMLHIGGWFDHNTEDNLKWFNAMRELSPAKDEQWLLMGPWTHGGLFTSMQGELDFPEAENSNNEYANAFFHHYLLEEDNGWQLTPRVNYFQMGDNVWLNTTSFPPSDASAEISYFLRDDMALSLDPGAIPVEKIFIYDPTDPSPTIGGKTLSPDLEQGPFDQSADVESRNDKLMFTTPLLTNDIVVKGRIKAHLIVTSDRPDTDFALRLTEVYPDGKSVALGQIIQRMRFRSGYTMADEEFLHLDDVVEIQLSFDNLAHTFKAGNQIGLIITSSNYPWFNRNMNTGDEMYPNDNLDTLVNPQLANNRLYIHGPFPSRIVLPVKQAPSNIVGLELDKFDLFPNPADDFLFIRNAPLGSTVQITDSKGTRIRDFLITENNQSIAVNDLIAGVYFLQLKAGSSITVEKFIVQHH